MAVPGRARPFLMALLALAAVPAAVRAHPLAPSLLEVHELDGGRADVSWKIPLLRPRGTAAEPSLPPRCRPLGPRQTVREDRDLRTRWSVACGPAGLIGARLGVVGLDGGIPALVRVTLRDGRLVQGFVSAAQPFLTVAPPPHPSGVIRDGVWLGIASERFALDHLLFVAGLVLLARTRRRILGTVTAFTAGHSVTLALAAFGLVDLPARPIEVAVALSVLVLAVELAREGDGPTLMRRFPWSTAAAAGLLHGLGFATALRAADVAAGESPLALASFNAGIELRQVAFVLAGLGLRAGLARVPQRMPAWARRLPVYGMGSLAAFWWLERTAALFR